MHGIVIFLGLAAMALAGFFIGWMCGWDYGRAAEREVWLLADSADRLQTHANVTRLMRDSH